MSDYNYTSPVQFSFVDPQPFSLEFRQGDKTIGWLREVDGQLIFEGDADASAKVFFDHVIERNSIRIKEVEAKLEMAVGVLKGVRQAMFEGCDADAFRMLEVALAELKEPR